MTKVASITKTDLMLMYGFSPSKLRKLMNVVFYDELVLAGYRKFESIVPPKVVAKFVECYGSISDNSTLEMI